MQRRNMVLAAATLAASTSTLVCCVLPAAMVALGAGAALATLAVEVPGLVWISEHKPLVFGGSAALLAFSGASLWRARRLPCPIDADQARACGRLRVWSARLWIGAVAVVATGAAFAFVLPRFR